MQAVHDSSLTETRPWLSAYSPGVPTTIDLDRFSSLVQLFEESCVKFRDRPAFRNFGKTITFGDLDEQSRAFGAYLQSLAIEKGARVAIMLPNVLQFPIALFGVLRAGFVAVNTNPLYTPHELEHQLHDSGAVAIVILANCAHTLEKVVRQTAVKHIITTQVGDMLDWPKSLVINSVVKYIRRNVPRYSLPQEISFGDTLAQGAKRALEPVALTREDIAFLQYTGGTTGLSKGAMLTHGNMVANALQCGAWHRPFLFEGTEVIVTALPLYHIFALTVNCLTFVQCGALNILITDPRDSKSFVATLKGLRFSAMTGVNTLFNRLLHTPGFAELDFSGLKVTLGGGMAVQQSVADHWQRVTGNVLIEGYGLTESSPMVCANPLDADKASGLIGIPVPSTECTIRDDDGNALAQGEVGELWFRGPQIMRGYWNSPETTAQTVTADGWLKTGDVGYMDPRGFVKLVDRKKDVIKVSGFSVFPNEIEEVVASHPGVMEAAAIAHPDADSGEVVKLFVVPKIPGLAAEEIKRYCRENLVPYKVPRIVEFRTELPKSPVGKILRRRLRESRPD